MPRNFLLGASLKFNEIEVVDVLVCAFEGACEGEVSGRFLSYASSSKVKKL